MSTWCYQINDGSVTLISKIVFVGNHEFSEDRLSEVINSREERWWRFLSTSDEYDPERLNFDKELLRRFYLKNGYIDFEVKDAKSELAPDRSGFFLTFTISEGDRYRGRQDHHQLAAAQPQRRRLCAAICRSTRAIGMTVTPSAAASMRWSSMFTIAAMRSSR